MLMRKNTAKTKFRGCGGCLPVFVSFQHISIAKFYNQDSFLSKTANPYMLRGLKIVKSTNFKNSNANDVL